MVEVPTNKPIIRDDEHDRVYRTAAEKYQAVIEEIKLARPRVIITLGAEVAGLLQGVKGRKTVGGKTITMTPEQAEHIGARLAGSQESLPEAEGGKEVAP